MNAALTLASVMLLATLVVVFLAKRKKPPPVQLQGKNSDIRTSLCNVWGSKPSGSGNADLEGLTDAAKTKTKSIAVNISTVAFTLAFVKKKKKREILLCKARVRESFSAFYVAPKDAHFILHLLKLS